MKNKFLSLLLIVAFVSLFTACPNVEKADIEKWNNASETVAKYSRQGSNIAFGLWESKAISLDMKNVIFDGFIYLDEGGVKFANFVKGLNLKDGDVIPKATLDKIKAALRADVLERFLDVLEKLKIIKLSDSMRNTIIAIKTAVLVFADSLDIGGSVKAQIEIKEKLLN